VRLRDFWFLFLLAGLVGFGMARGGGPMQATWEREGGTGHSIGVPPSPPQGGTGGVIPIPPSPSGIDDGVVPVPPTPPRP